MWLSPLKLIHPTASNGKLLLGQWWNISCRAALEYGRPYDFDEDGYGDFIATSSYTGQFCNDAMHYEAVGNDSIDLKWVYTFSTLSCEFDNYSSVAVGDIDNDQNPEIIALMDTRPGVAGQDGLYIFEWTQQIYPFPIPPLQHGACC